MGSSLRFCSENIVLSCIDMERVENMARILILFMALSTYSALQNPTRESKLFYVSTTSTTSTLTTSTICYVAAALHTICAKRKKKSIIEDSPSPVFESSEDAMDIDPSYSSEMRKGKFLLYWMTTTDISTTTSYTKTASMATLTCIPLGWDVSPCG